ncbi:ATP-binding protein [Streptosporangium lutulentum]
MTATRPDARRVPYIALGTAVNGDAPVGVELEALRKHTAIFAGSGSGKTVLIRNLIERCALQGVSAIVLDPNNDLARMGDPWPEAPEQWASGDAARAAEYLTYTDVVVWTPGLTLGRPLSFQPLPDFASVLDDADEFNEAIEVAVASIVPKAKLGANTHKAQLGQAVLRETLKYYARRGGPTSLAGLIEMLSALPEG